MCKGAHHQYVIIDKEGKCQLHGLKEEQRSDWQG